MRQNHLLVFPRRRLFVCECATERRLPLQRGEEGRRHRQPADLDRFAALGKIDGPPGKQGGLLNAGAWGTPIEVVRDRHGRLFQPHQRVAVPDKHQPFGVRIRQRPHRIW